MARKGKYHTWLSAAAANGAGAAFDVSNFDEITVYVGAPTATLTVKCIGTLEATEPSAANWAAAASVSNKVDGIAMIWKNDATTVVNGNTGVALAGAAHARMYKINTEDLKWINFVVSGFSAGSVTVNGHAVRKTT